MSQADALLSRLAREWHSEFDQLCQLVAVSAVVCTDETSWSQNSVWAFLSEHARRMIFGGHQDAAPLETLLPKATFAGVLVSDDAGRQCRIDELELKRCDLCAARVHDRTSPRDKAERDFDNLAHKLARRMGANPPRRIPVRARARSAGHQQRVGTDSANPGAEPPHRPNHSQCSRSSPPHDPDQRAGIAAHTAACVRRPVRAGGGQPLVSDGPMWLWPDPEKAGPAPPGGLPARPSRAAAAGEGQHVLTSDRDRQQFQNRHEPPIASAVAIPLRPTAASARLD